MGGEWRPTTWGDEISLEYGKALRGYADVVGQYRVYGSNGPIGWTHEALAPGPGVILGRKGAYRGVRYSTEPFYVIDTAYYVRPRNEFDMRWLYYAIIHHKLGEIDDGSPIPSTTRSAVYVRDFDVPPLPEQRAIASILGALDDKIELNRRMNETLEGMARALFKDWFVDFGPVRAKANGGAPYLSDDLWALFPDRLSDDGLPEGWEMGTMGDEFDITMGQSPPGDTYNDEGVGLPFFQGRTDFGFRYPTNRKFCSNPSRLANAGDTLISVRAPVGDLNMAIEVCCIGRGVAAARHKTGVRGFTAYAMHSIQPELQMFENSGTVFGAINKVQFEKLKIVAPPTDIVAAFEAQVIEVDELIRNNTEQNYTLAATRDLLLPKLMSGALRVADATRVLEDAL